MVPMTMMIRVIIIIIIKRRRTEIKIRIIGN